MLVRLQQEQLQDNDQMNTCKLATACCLCMGGVQQNSWANVGWTLVHFLAIKKLIKAHTVASKLVNKAIPLIPHHKPLGGGGGGGGEGGAATYTNMSALHMHSLWGIQEGMVTKGERKGAMYFII